MGAEITNWDKGDFKPGQRLQVGTEHVYKIHVFGGW